MRNKLALVLVAGILAGPIAANATPVTYDITVASSNWQTSGTVPFGLGAQPHFSGSVTLDNALSGYEAFLSFSLTTGTHTWTMADYVGPTTYNNPLTSTNFDSSGNLIDFGLNNFTFAGVNMYFYSSNTMNIYDNSGNGIYCNGCISLSRTESTSVPEPTTLGLLGIGLAGIGFARRRRVG